MNVLQVTVFPHHVIVTITETDKNLHAKKDHTYIIWDRFAIKLKCVIMTPLGIPVVPLL